MKNLQSLVIFAILVAIVRHVSTEALVQSRDPNLCYECDSRFEPYCEDTFNTTDTRVRIIPCNGRCAKLKHWHEEKFYYKRACINSMKKYTLIRYTVEVCYADEENGYFCLCDDHFCNHATKAFNKLCTFSSLVLHRVKLIGFFLVFNSYLMNFIFY
jgi:hypothetical protein